MNYLFYDGGEPMETVRHWDQMNVLIASLKLHWADRADYYVGDNMVVYYDPSNKRCLRGNRYQVRSGSALCRLGAGVATRR
jgi:hypothetical protein